MKFSELENTVGMGAMVVICACLAYLINRFVVWIGLTDDPEDGE